MYTKEDQRSMESQDLFDPVMSVVGLQLMKGDWRKGKIGRWMDPIEVYQRKFGCLHTKEHITCSKPRCNRVF